MPDETMTPRARAVATLKRDSYVMIPTALITALMTGAVVTLPDLIRPAQAQAQAQATSLRDNADFVRVESRVQELGGDLIANTTNDIKVEGQVIKKLDSIETKIDRLIDRLLETRTEKP